MNLYEEYLTEIKSRKEQGLSVEVADGVKVRVLQNTIAQVLSKTEPTKDK